MDVIDERQRNHATYRRLKGAIDQTYAPGRFVAISEGQVIADAARLEELCSLLRAAGKDPTNVLIVQAGADYPETAIIFLHHTTDRQATGAVPAAASLVPGRGG